MYLHIGSGKNIRKRDIIGIFDMDTATVSRSSRDFIRSMERSRLVEYEDRDIPRSFILLGKQGKDVRKGSERRKNIKNFKRKRDSYIHLSKISTAALRTRVDSTSYYEYDENNQ